MLTRIYAWLSTTDFHLLMSAAACLAKCIAMGYISDWVSQIRDGDINYPTENGRVSKYSLTVNGNGHLAKANAGAWSTGSSSDMKGCQITTVEFG
jgi:hypothetical protein